MVAKVHLLEDAREVLLQPSQRRLLDAVLPRGDNHQVAAAAQALQAVVCSCAPSPAVASQAAIRVMQLLSRAGHTNFYFFTAQPCRTYDDLSEPCLSSMYFKGRQMHDLMLARIAAKGLDLPGMGKMPAAKCCDLKKSWTR